MATTNRISRETTSRANTSRRKPWQPPAKLDAPQLQMDMNIDGSEPPFVVKMINQMFFPE